VQLDEGHAIATWPRADSEPTVLVRERQVETHEAPLAEEDDLVLESERAEPLSAARAEKDLAGPLQPREWGADAAEVLARVLERGCGARACLTCEDLGVERARDRAEGVDAEGESVDGVGVEVDTGEVDAEKGDSRCGLEPLDPGVL